MPLLFTSLLDAGGGFPSVAPPPEPVFELVGESSPFASCGAGRLFEANAAFAQRYLAGYTGKVVALAAWFSDTAAANFRMGLYADAGGLPGALLAQTAGGSVAPVTGWQEFALAPKASVDVVASGHYWIAGQADSHKGSCTPSSLANLGRRFRSAAYAGGLPDPFGAASSYNNSRSVRMRIWTNPP